MLIAADYETIRFPTKDEGRTTKVGPWSFVLRL